MNEVERIYEELKLVGQIVMSSNDVSAITAHGEYSAKVLLLAGASYFERKIISSIKEHISSVTTDASVQHFVFHQAVERKFFSLFDFSAETKNINAFLSKFGSDYQKWAQSNLKMMSIDPSTQVAFLNFCRLRNSLVHSNYATYDINKTLDEVWTEFKTAELLVEWIESSFHSFSGTPRLNET